MIPLPGAAVLAELQMGLGLSEVVWAVWAAAAAAAAACDSMCVTEMGLWQVGIQDTQSRWLQVFDYAHGIASGRAISK